MGSAVKDQNLKKEAWNLCKKFIGSTWEDIPLEEFVFSEVSGGLSNNLYRCALPKSVSQKDSQVPHQVLLRIYGPIQDDPNIVVQEAVTFMLLSERHLGPKLYGLFPKGRLEEFIPSHSLSSDEIRRFSPLIAREMAKVHSLNFPLRKIPDMWETCLSKWLEEVKEFLSSNTESSIISYNEYKTEVKWMSSEMKKSKSSVVYCHNDLQGGNILYREDTTNGYPDLMLIDFEFGAYNYSTFDIANHFCEWSFDYLLKEFPHFTMKLEKFPSKQEQAEYVTAYLQQLAQEGIQLRYSFKEEMQIILDEIDLFAAASHLLWSLWSIKMSQISNFGFAHKEHGKTRLKLHQKFKEEHIKSKKQNNIQ